MDHLNNPEIVKQFEWDAQKVYRFDGECSKRIFTEPWTGKRFWKIQVKKLLRFHLRFTLIDYKVIIARRRKDGLPRALRGQDPALVIWNGEGVPRYGEDCKPPSGGSQ